MPEIKFKSEWLKIGDNVKDGDVIKFLDAGTLDEESERWIFNVAVFSAGKLTEPSKKFNLNKGNFKATAAEFGTNSDEWINKEMKVTKVKVRNPQTGLNVDSIALEKSDVAPQPTDEEKVAAAGV